MSQKGRIILTRFMSQKGRIILTRFIELQFNDRSPDLNNSEVQQDGHSTYSVS